MKRSATLVGCNYPGHSYELYGCINDVAAIKELLIDRFQFQPDDIVVLTDAPGTIANALPTSTKIKSALKNMKNKAVKGDLLLFYFSGLGCVTKAREGDVQAIVPCDWNIITGIDFQSVADDLPEGVTFTFIADSSFSGGLMPSEGEQIGPSTVDSINITSESHKKTISSQSLLDQLSSLSNIESPHVGNHILNLFGTDASIVFSSTTPQVSWPDLGILLSACQSNEEAFEIYDAKGIPHGAFTYALHAVLNDITTPLSNKALVNMARKNLKDKGITQHPCLYCSTDEIANTPFLLEDK